MIDLDRIAGAWALPRPDWTVIGEWIGDNLAEDDRSAGWTEAVRQWLTRLGAALAGDYVVMSRSHFLALVPSCNPFATRLLDFAEFARQTIREFLGHLAWDNPTGPHVVLLFADDESYYAYVATLSPPGDWGGSAGICLRDGYVHFALRPYPFDELTRCLAHELTHVLLTMRSLPSWLEEGIAMWLERRVGDRAGHFIGAERLRDVRNYWQGNGLSDFWWGSGFHLPDEGQSASYDLAQVLFELLRSDFQKGYWDFVRDARREDAGESAANCHLGLSLSQLAARFLGPGDWVAVPPDAKTFLKRSKYQLESGYAEEALADIEAAIRLEPERPEGLIARGDWYRRRENYMGAKADYEAALAVAPRDTRANHALAWFLATCPDDTLRDGATAVELADFACARTGYHHPSFLAALAAAYAESADYDEAIRWIKDAIRLAEPAYRDTYREFLRAFQQGRPVLDSTERLPSTRAGE